jgi:hypothetical protein
MTDVARNLEIEARGAQRLVIWTDCDREGSSLFNLKASNKFRREYRIGNCSSLSAIKSPYFNFQSSFFRCTTAGDITCNEYAHIPRYKTS